MPCMVSRSLYVTYAGIHDDGIKWKHFPRYWTSVRGIHRSPVNSPHKGQWRGALMFSLIWVWIDGCVNKSWGWWLETLSRPLWCHCNGGFKFWKGCFQRDRIYLIIKTQNNNGNNMSFDEYLPPIQYIPWFINTVRVLFRFVTGRYCPYSSRLLLCHWGTHASAS